MVTCAIEGCGEPGLVIPRVLIVGMDGNVLELRLHIPVCDACSDEPNPFSRDTWDRMLHASCDRGCSLPDPVRHVVLRWEWIN